MTRPTICTAFLLLAAANAAPQAKPPVNGVWRSVGYGMVLAVDDTVVRTYEVTDVSCIPGGVWRRTSGGVSDGRFMVGNQEVELIPGPGADEARQHIPPAASDRYFRRIAAVPERCASAMPSDPLTTFDVVWETYREHYPFFSAKHVDWDAVRAASRPRVAGASPESLFTVLRGMIEPLHDAHTFLVARDLKKVFGGQRMDPDTIGEPGAAKALEIIKTKYLRTPLRSWANEHVQFGMLPDSIGYLRITAFAGYVLRQDYAAQLNALDAALDTIFAETRGWRGLVIDVRINDGGEDPLGLAIASRLATAPYTAYAKVARSDPSDATKMTPPQPSVVRPSTRPGWRGPVVELTSRYSVSAAETFTQALMGRRPAVARIGENTQGVFSDVLGRRLPNGWQFGLPNELFLTEQGTSFDGPGIPPTIPVPTITTADLTAGRDPALERAIAELRGATPSH